MLEGIGRKHGTDKVAHGYLPLYERYLLPWRMSDAVMVEVGVWHGASVKMWLEWMPQVKVHGVDILGPWVKNPRYEHHQGSVMDEGFMRTLPGSLAVVVDDGGHKGDQVEAAWMSLWPRLVSGGVYAVEDIHAGYWGKEFAPSMVPFLKGLFDNVHDAGHGPFEVRELHIHESLLIAVKK